MARVAVPLEHQHKWMRCTHMKAMFVTLEVTHFEMSWLKLVPLNLPRVPLREHLPLGPDGSEARGLGLQRECRRTCFPWPSRSRYPMPRCLR